MQHEKEFIEIIQAHQGLIYKVAKVYTYNKEDQQDLYQDIVYQLWKSYDSFRNEAKGQYLDVSGSVEYFYYLSEQIKKKRKAHPYR